MNLLLLVFVFLTVPAVSLVLELPGRVVFKMGERRELRCGVRSCPQEPKFVWIQLQDKPLFTTIKNHHRQSVMIFDSVTRNHETIVLCKATCGKTTKQAKAAIHVYSSPGKPVLSGNDHMVLDEENLLTCEVSHAYPPEFLEVEWIYGDTVLHREEGEPDDENFKSSYRFRPSSEDDGKVITCKASLNLDGVPPDEMMKETSGHLRVLSAPHNVRISGLTAVSLGSSLTLTCEADGSPDSAFTWTALKQDGGSVDMGKHQELFIHTVSLSDASVYQCEVNNQLGRQTASISVVVQAPPMNTRIKASPQAVLKEGESVSIFCTSDGTPVDHMELRRTVDSRETQLKSSAGSETSVTLDSVKLDDSGLYVCEAFNEFGSEKITLHLTIEAHSFEVELQPDGETVAERDSSLVLSCQASGCPQPTFSWKSFANTSARVLTETNGFLSQLFLDPVESEKEGTYICEVTCGSVTKSKQTKINVFSSNQYGSNSDSVEITVKAPPRNTTVEVFPSSEVQEGQNITICCISVSSPPPAVVLRKLDSDSVIYSPDGVFNMINLTRNDTGLYQVNITNDLGYELEIFTINVMEIQRSESPSNWDDFVTTTVCLAAAAVILVIVVHLWRETKKKGSNDLTKSNSDTV